MKIRVSIYFSLILSKCYNFLSELTINKGNHHFSQLMELLHSRRFEASANEVIVPIFFRLTKHEDAQALEHLLQADPSIVIHDEIYGQLRELIKSLHPTQKFDDKSYAEKIEQHLNGVAIDDYGVWVYYPWSKRVVHLLDEEEFVEIRTNRNRYKITRTEQANLKKRKIGVIGLSVGQSIALTLAMERTCGELRLADFDTAELSNLNRIRTGVQNLGLYKTIIAAREIAEIDPFIKVEIFNNGINKDNIDKFFTGDGNIDLLVEVCDGLDIKIISRFKARELKIPVVMDTNDRGMLDVERFDLEPDRPILHGLADGLDPESIKDLTNEEKIPYILKMVSAHKISSRLKSSMIEVEQTINTWPQLASSVTLGGAITTDVCRRILLDQYHDSGRYYVDIENIVCDKSTTIKEELPENYFAPAALPDSAYTALAKNYQSTIPTEVISNDDLHNILNAAILAPSGGNCQPWKFVYEQGRLFLFHDLSASYSFLDYKSYGAYVAFGAVIQNIEIRSQSLGYNVDVDATPIENKDNHLIAVISFTKANQQLIHPLNTTIEVRNTNRNIGLRTSLKPELVSELKTSIQNIGNDTRLDIIQDPSMMAELGDILATTEKLLLMHPRGHNDAFNKEIRWTEEENQEKKDGIDVATLGITKGEISAFRVAHDRKAIEFLRETIRGGNAFKKMATKAVAAAAGLGVLTVDKYSEKNFFYGGKALERIWLEVNSRQISLQPISQFTFLIARLVDGNGLEMDSFYQNEFLLLKDRFYKLLPHLEGRVPVFTFRICEAEPPIMSLRKDMKEVLLINN